MMEPSDRIEDRNLEAATTLSLKREPACFAFLCGRAVLAPLPIDVINLDLASVDFFEGRSSLWATLEVRSGAATQQPIAVLGFDETFLRPFARALIEAAASRTAHRMTIRREAGRREDGTEGRRHVVEYVTGPGVALQELILVPHDNVVGIAGRAFETEAEESLFQLPRSDSFLRAFVKMAHQADQTLRDTLTENERLAKKRAVG
ncbi:MAG TPA: hypothetical protein VKT70_11910 [Stellaceae bacterium]|nr:hypothetical protein [Stellaceae bacterium]